MRRPLRQPLPPLWFCLALALLVRAAAHVLDLAPREAEPVSLAWFQWLVIVAQAIWTGIQIAGQVTLATLQWAIHWVWVAISSLTSGLAAFGHDLFTGMKTIWTFLEDLYDKVLKPVWEKFWKVVDWAKEHLERIIKPVIDFLRHIRAELLAFYEKWVRPALDLIGVFRKALDVLTALGVEWAKQLDAKLAWLEAKIYEPFAFLLRKLNEVINVVDRVITADGLFQRLALVRSIERDLKYIQRAWANARSKPLTEAEKEDLRKRLKDRTPTTIVAEHEIYLRTGQGPVAPLINELVAILKPLFGAR